MRLPIFTEYLIYLSARCFPNISQEKQIVGYTRHRQQLVIRLLWNINLSTYGAYEKDREARTHTLIER